MAYVYDFLDGETYGTIDINAIRKTLCTAGVVLETTLSCKVIFSGTTDQYLITLGQAIFATGARIEIDSEGVTLTATAGVINYIWLENDTVANTISPKITTTEATGDCVKLATISAAGVVTDMRDISIFKIPGALVNITETQEISIDYTFLGTDDWELVDSIEVLNNNYNFANATGAIYDTNYRLFYGSQNLNSNVYSGFLYMGTSGYGYSASSEGGFGVDGLSGLTTLMKFEKQGSNINIYLWRKYGSATSITFDFTLDLY